LHEWCEYKYPEVKCFQHTSTFQGMLIRTSSDQTVKLKHRPWRWSQDSSSLEQFSRSLPPPGILQFVSTQCIEICEWRPLCAKHTGVREQARTKQNFMLSVVPNNPICVHGSNKKEPLSVAPAHLDFLLHDSLHWPRAREQPRKVPATSVLKTHKNKCPLLTKLVTKRHNLTSATRHKTAVEVARTWDSGVADCQRPRPGPSWALAVTIASIRVAAIIMVIWWRVGRILLWRMLSRMTRLDMGIIIFAHGYRLDLKRLDVLLWHCEFEVRAVQHKERGIANKYSS
jgi:hypothetical protein